MLGDLVDYGPCPQEVVDWVREHADFVIAGNHDHAMAAGLEVGALAARQLNLAITVWVLHTGALVDNIVPGLPALSPASALDEPLDSVRASVIE